MKICYFFVATVPATNITNSPNISTTPKPASTVVTCLNYEFKCYRSNMCIHKSWLCDGEADCTGSEDEDPLTCSSNQCNEVCRFSILHLS